MKITTTQKWMETLSKLASQARKDGDKWHKSDKPLYPLSMTKLIGHASSAKTILELEKNKKDNEIDREELI